jgi:hypothetical protein
LTLVAVVADFDFYIFYIFIHSGCRGQRFEQRQNQRLLRMKYSTGHEARKRIAFVLIQKSRIFAWIASNGIKSGSARWKFGAEL